MSSPGRNGPVVLLRADAGGGIGTGHLMRMRALAEGLCERGAEVHLLTGATGAGLLAPFRELGVHILAVESTHPDPADAAGLVAARDALRPSWLIVDGYHFDVGYLRAASASDARVVVVDDMAHLDRYPVAAVLNQNAHASMLDYRADPGTRLLLGTEYALLRSEYRAAPPAPRKVADVRSVVVAAGGGDPHRVTELVIEALARVRPSFRTTIVVGPANPRVAAIRRAAAALGPDVRVLHAVPRMRDLLADADLAISTAGSTVWELAYMGVPALLVEAGEAERLLLAGLERIGLFVRIGVSSALDADTVAAVIAERVADRDWRAAMSERGTRTVDGRGVDRVLDATIGAVA